MSAAGDKAATATDDHRVQIWDLLSGHLCHDLAVSWLPHAASSCGSIALVMESQRHAQCVDWAACSPQVLANLNSPRTLNVVTPCCRRTRMRSPGWRSGRRRT